MPATENHFPEFAGKMHAANLSEAAIRAFQYSFETLVAGYSGLIPEAAIEPVLDLPRFEQVGRVVPNAPPSDPTALLSQTVVIKLNGGLGTSMGLERAKSLLPVKEGLTFLDFIARQILHLRQKHRVPLRLLLMNSFSTSADSLEFLQKYPELGEPKSLELMQ